MNQRELEIALSIIESEMTRGIEHKACFYNECASKTIRAHSIQNNRILNRISRDGQVMCTKPSIVDGDLGIDMVEVGRGVASTFRGFCNEHDTEIFKPIEHADYTRGDTEQEYLFAYRALAREYNAKYKARTLYERMANLSDDEFNSIRKKGGLTGTYTAYFINQLGDRSLRGTLESLEKLEGYRVIMNMNLDRRRFWKVETKIIEVSGFHPIAASAFTFIERDVDGNVVNDLKIYKDMKPLFLTTFPQEDKTFALLGYFARNRDSFRFIDEQILAEDEVSQKVILSNLMTQYVENMFISPARWQELSTEEQRNFKSLYQRTMFEKNSLVLDHNLDLFI